MTRRQSSFSPPVRRVARERPSWPPPGVSQRPSPPGCNCRETVSRETQVLQTRHVLPGRPAGPYTSPERRGPHTSLIASGRTCGARNALPPRQRHIQTVAPRSFDAPNSTTETSRHRSRQHRCRRCASHLVTRRSQPLPPSHDGTPYRAPVRHCTPRRTSRQRDRAARPTPVDRVTLACCAVLFSML